MGGRREERKRWGSAHLERRGGALWGRRGTRGGEVGRCLETWGGRGEWGPEAKVLCLAFELVLL